MPSAIVSAIVGCSVMTPRSSIPPTATTAASAPTSGPRRIVRLMLAPGAVNSSAPFESSRTVKAERQSQLSHGGLPGRNLIESLLTCPGGVGDRPAKHRCELLHVVNGRDLAVRPRLVSQDVGHDEVERAAE